MGGEDVLAADLLQRLVDALHGELSGRLAASLERDGAELDGLPPDWQGRELRRLVGRHGGSVDVGSILAVLAQHRPGHKVTDVVAPLALVARFIAAETRPTEHQSAESRDES
jgi:hypothetical protein